MSRSKTSPRPYRKSLWFVVLLCMASLMTAAEPESKTNEPIKQGTLVEPTQGPIVVLADGGLLVARPTGITETKRRTGVLRTLFLDSGLFGKVQLPIDRVAGILFQVPPGVEARDAAVAKLLGGLQAQDRVTLVNGDQLDGPVLGIQNRRISVETSFGKTDLKTEQIASITFTQPQPAANKPRPQPPLFFTGWSDGSRFPVAKITKTPQKRLQVWPYATTRQPWTVAADRFRFLQPLAQKEIVYLSDLVPSEYQHTPFLDRKLPLGNDRNVLGHPLRAGGQLYPKGLGTASRSKIIYPLDKPYSRFEAALAIDDSTGGRGSVIFRVLLDGKLVYTSPTIRGGQCPVPISIDTTDAKQLELEVDYATGADQLDHADWLDARFKRGQN